MKTNKPKTKSPRGFWYFRGPTSYGATIWANSAQIIVAISGVHWVANSVDPPHWEWCISFSSNGGRCSDNQIEYALEAFDFEGAEEDNHEPGIARKFWLAVDEKYRKPCPCKDEEIVTESDGYQWSKKRGT